jgi:hypothetical protein
MTDWQIPAALRNFGSVSQGVYVRKGSKPVISGSSLPAVEPRRIAITSWATADDGQSVDGPSTMRSAHTRGT